MKNEIIFVLVVTAIAFVIFPKILKLVRGFVTLKEGLESPWKQLTKPGQHLACNSGPGTGYTPKGNVNNLQECQKICENDTSCKYITYMGGYNPKECSMFTGNCNLAAPGKAYFYGNHEVWEINRNAIKANAAAAAAKAAEKIRAAEAAAAKAAAAEAAAKAAKAAAELAAAADKAEALAKAAAAVKKAEEDAAAAAAAKAAAKKAAEEAAAAAAAEAAAADKQAADEKTGEKAGEDLANQSTAFSKFHAESHLEDNNLAAASSLAQNDRLNIEELLKPRTSKAGDVTRSGNAINYANNSELKSIEGESIPVVAASLPTAKAAAAASAIGNLNGKTPSPNLEIANITFIYAPSLEGRRSLPSQRSMKPMERKKERNYGNYIKNMGNTMGPSLMNSMGTPSAIAKRSPMTQFPPAMVKDFNSVWSGLK